MVRPRRLEPRSFAYQTGVLTVVLRPNKCPRQDSNLHQSSFVGRCPIQLGDEGQPVCKASIERYAGPVPVLRLWKSLVQLLHQYRAMLRSPPRTRTSTSASRAPRACQLHQRGMAERAGFAPAAGRLTCTRLAGGPIRLLWQFSASGGLEARTPHDCLAKAACALRIPLDRERAGSPVVFSVTSGAQCVAPIPSR